MNINPDYIVIIGVILLAIGLTIEVTLFEYFTDLWKMLDKNKIDTYKTAALIVSLSSLLSGVSFIIIGILTSLY